MTARLPRCWRWLLTVAVLMSLRLPGTAQAHAAYVRSEPGAGAVVAAPPTQVEIWFSQDMFRRQGENWITVVGPAGEPVQAGDAVIDDDDRRHMMVPLQAGLPVGVYTVTWRTLSAEDGDDEEGSFSFTLDPAAQATSTPMRAATATTPPLTSTPAPAVPGTPAGSGGGTGCGAALAPAVGLVLAGGLAWTRRRRPA